MHAQCSGVAAAMHVSSNTEGVVKPTTTFILPMEFVQALGKMQAADFGTFLTSGSAATGHGVARVNKHLLGYVTFTPRTCHAAGLTCDEEFVVMDPYTNADRAPLVQSQFTVRDPHIETINDLQKDFFLESSLQVGSKVDLTMNLRSPFPTRRFLPNKISESLPTLKIENLGKLLSTFLIRPNTPMATVIGTAAYLCGNPAMPMEERACHTSFEGMAQFATSKLGTNNVRILATTRALAEASIPTEEVRVAGFHKRSITEGKHVVICHDLMFPSALTYCHAVQGTKVVQVSLENESVARNQISAVAICHLNTTNWLSRHPVFAVLNITKGEEACHFLTEGDIVWVVNSATDEV